MSREGPSAEVDAPVITSGGHRFDSDGPSPRSELDIAGCLATLGAGRVAAYRALAANGSEATLRKARACYVCKQPFRRLHAFYHALCPECAARNFAARSDAADLTGRRAIVTGGRIKIGFDVARQLLAAGARVTITTRFPHDAARRFAEAGLAGQVEIV